MHAQPPQKVSLKGSKRTMNDDAMEFKRVKFYGATDLATYWQVERMAEVTARFDADAAPATVVEAIELHNVQLYIESGILPASYSEAERAAAVALVPHSVPQSPGSLSRSITRT